MNAGFNSSNCIGCGTGFLAGAAASIATTWITQRTEAVRADSEWKLRECESLYKEFIKEVSRLTIDALAHSLEKPGQLIGALRDSELHSTHVRGRDCAARAKLVAIELWNYMGGPI